MKGDFSRISFDATKHFSRVLLQQGRVTVDADPNESAEILLHYVRTLARDLIGPYGGPPDNLGFQLGLDTSDASHPRLRISAGRYYVDGILVENDADVDYATQPHYTPGQDDPLLERLATGEEGDDFWLYLDVWERHVSWIEDDSIREPALGGPDTCSRTQVVWQVRALARTALIDTLSAERDQIVKRLQDTTLSDDERAALETRRDRLVQDIQRLTGTTAQPGNDCNAPLDVQPPGDALMAARVDPGPGPKDPCTIAPDALYRGPENQLYRVEVQRGSAPGVTPTFKWSRDNASVAARWLSTDGNDLVVSSGRGFGDSCWVELSEDGAELQGQPGLLVRVTKVDGDRLSVDPASVPTGQSLVFATGALNPKVRRWDQSDNDDITLVDGAVPIREASATDPAWIALEDGVQVQFQPGGHYRSGDYWVIPARVATGGIEWPRTVDAAGNVTWTALPPRGVVHHWAPLGFVGRNADGRLDVVAACLCQLLPINSCSRLQRNGALPRPLAARAKTTAARHK